MEEGFIAFMSSFAGTLFIVSTWFLLLTNKKQTDILTVIVRLRSRFLPAQRTCTKRSASEGVER